MSEKTYGKEGVSFPVKGSGKWIAGKYVKYRNLEISAVWQKSGRVVKGTGKMRKAQKRQIEEFTTLLEQAHKEIKRCIETHNTAAAMDLLAQCQEGAVRTGELIEKTEGEDCPAIRLVENYCELVYQIYGELNRGEDGKANNVHKRLHRLLIQVENSIRNDIKVRFEMVFLPYKASMWDSLESVWQAADADPACDAYVVPIPYYDRNPDGSLGIYHYEGNDLPSYVQAVHYDRYSFADRKPDAVFIHTPYDNANYVTSIDPRFYSGQLKKHTECLVYIPYYATAGGMSEGQAQCPAYYNADYIIIQAPKYCNFFDQSVPREKLLPLGSPKFDRVIRTCGDPPKPPEEWEGKMTGKKVYFYNTSIQGMLGNTEAFLKKMEYVFQCFRGREDACLLWRPHPLLESTFHSMRPMYKPVYDALRNEFINESAGIYDDTPDIETAIAHSDAYIGDAGTSVTSLFGVAGKPLFILNNYINTPPGEEDWRGEAVNPVFDIWGDDRYQITKNNQLWFAENNDYHYKFYMDLGTGYSSGGYYIKAVESGDKIYVLPGNAQDFLIIQDKKIRKINLPYKTTQAGAFWSYLYNEKYIFLLPNQYPWLVRIDTITEKISYVDGVNQFNVRNVEGERRVGGVCPYGNELVFASPEDNRFLFLDMDTLEGRVLTSGSKCGLGAQGIVPEGDNLWLLPLNGTVLTCWNPKTEETREYGDLPEGFRSVQWPHNLECEERPFGAMVFYEENGKENIVISPSWGNMYVSLDRGTGKMEEWETPLPFQNRGRNGYFTAGGMGGFVVGYSECGKANYRIWYAPERKLYDVNITTKEYREIPIEFDPDELKAHEPGFMEESEWMQYCLNEGAFNSLGDFLDGRVTGNQFDRDRQIKAFSKINADTEGVCGENVYRFVREKIGNLA